MHQVRRKINWTIKINVLCFALSFLISSFSLTYHSATTVVVVSQTVPPTVLATTLPPGVITSFPTGGATTLFPQTIGPGVGTLGPSTGVGTLGPTTATVPPVVTTPTVTDADLLRCKQQMEMSDADRNFLLNEAEYISFINRLANFAFIQYTSLATMPAPLSQNFNTLAAPTGGTAISIPGATSPFATSQPILDNICTVTGQAIHLALNGVAGNIFSHNPTTITTVAPTLGATTLTPGSVIPGATVTPTTLYPGQIVTVTPSTLFPGQTVTPTTLTPGATVTPSTISPATVSPGMTNGTAGPSTMGPTTAAPSADVFRAIHATPLLTIHSSYIMSVVAPAGTTAANLPEATKSNLEAGYARFVNGAAPTLIAAENTKLHADDVVIAGNATTTPGAVPSIPPVGGNATGASSTVSPGTAGPSTAYPVTTLAPIGTAGPTSNLAGQTIAPVLPGTVAPTNLAGQPINPVAPGTAVPTNLAGQPIGVPVTPASASASPLPVTPAARYLRGRQLQTVAPVPTVPPVATVSPVATVPAVATIPPVATVTAVATLPPVTTVPAVATIPPVTTTGPSTIQTIAPVGGTIGPSTISPIPTIPPVGGTVGPSTISPVLGTAGPSAVAGTAAPSGNLTSAVATQPPVATVAPVATAVPTLVGDFIQETGPYDTLLVTASPRILKVEDSTRCSPPTDGTTTVCLRIYAAYDVEVAAEQPRQELYDRLVSETQIQIAGKLQAAMDPTAGATFVEASQPADVDPFPPATTAPEPTEAPDDDDGGGGNAFATYGGMAIGIVSAIVCCLGGFIGWRNGWFNRCLGGGDDDDDYESKANTNDGFNDEDDDDD